MNRKEMAVALIIANTSYIRLVIVNLVFEATRTAKAFEDFARAYDKATPAAEDRQSLDD